VVFFSLHTNIRIVSSIRFGHSTEIQKKLFATYKQNVSQYVTEDNTKLQTKVQKEPGEVMKETSGCVRPERVNKWNSPF
jgi:hypothetical protein